MKKVAAMGTALVLCVALGVTSLAFGETIKVKSKITLSFANGGGTYSPYTQDTFFGQVKAKKGCKKNRTVKLVGTTLKDKTDKAGDYAIGAGNASAGSYTTKVKKKKFSTGNGDRVVCKAKTSKPVVVG
jgi:hypothetical protein